MDTILPFAGAHYFLFLGLLIFARGMDFLSTWIATPNLVMEASPISKRLGWRGGLIVHFLICLGLAAWPLPAIMVITTSLLVAARNLQSAWLMRSFGEDRYRSWISERFRETSPGLYLFCVLTQTLLVTGIGCALIFCSAYPDRSDFAQLVPFAVGAGIIAYAVVAAVFTSLALWRLRRLSS